MNTAILTTLLSLNAAARSGGTVTADQLTPWLDSHLPSLRSRIEALRDGVLSGLIEAAYRRVFPGG